MVINTDWVEVLDASPANANTLVTKEYWQARYPVEYVASVSLKATGLTKMFTTLTGKWLFVCTEVVFHCDNVSGLSSQWATISVGYLSGDAYSNFVSAQWLWNNTSSAATNLFWFVTLRSNSATRKGAPENTDIYLNCTVASNATNATYTIVVRWYYTEFTQDLVWWTADAWTDQIDCSIDVPPTQNTLPTKGYRKWKWAIFRKTVNCTVNGTVLMWTTESGKGRFFPYDIWVIANNIAGLGLSWPTIAIWHTASSYTDWLASGSLPNSSWDVWQYTQLSVKSAGTSRLSAPASTNVYVNVAAGDATTYTVDVIVRGFYSAS